MFPIGLSMSPGTAAVLITVATLLAVSAGGVMLRRAWAQPRLLPEEFTLAAAWIFVVGGLVWLGVFLAESSLLGFGSPWTWLAAAHFVFAGFGALTITALACRVVSCQRSLRILRVLLLAHPVAYLVVAAGISGFRYCDEVGSAIYAVIFVAQLGAVLFGRPDRIAKGPRLLLLVALTVPIATMVPAIAWAWGKPIFDLVGMIRYHGIINAIGHVGLGLAAFAWGRPPAQTELGKDEPKAP